VNSKLTVAAEGDYVVHHETADAHVSAGAVSRRGASILAIAEACLAE
jgi:hypothetical protein